MFMRGENDIYWVDSKSFLMIYCNQIFYNRWPQAIIIRLLIGTPYQSQNLTALIHYRSSQRLANKTYCTERKKLLLGF